MTLALTYVEKDEIKKSFEERKEDKLDAEFVRRLNLISHQLDAGLEGELSYNQRMIIVQQLELKLETDLPEILKDKYNKIIKKVSDI